ncbi:MAG TPA: SRPBCC family protein [Ktedonobacterales bacterium]|jgi:uncharacterized membrane protein|nr:SRPBCC family protein [Ktedonobacterales bacterium]
MQGTSPTASAGAPQVAARQAPGQSRRGRGSVNSGRGERLIDLTLGGGLVAASVYSGLRRRWALTAPFAVSGGWLLYAGATGHFSPYAALGLVRSGQRSDGGLLTQRSITISRPRTVVYAYWRDLSHLPTFMPDLISVTEEGARSHWVATAPLQATVAWDAELTDERPGELLAWRSLPGADVTNAGEVHFADAPGERGCEITLSLTYDPPAGTAGAAAARIFRKEPSQQVDESLRRLKAILEAGEAPTTEGQPHGRLGAGSGRLMARMRWRA